jgi:hypothetical protein
MKNQDETDFHVFETNHPYFIELGLGTFTTGTLLEWWNERDNLGRYLNRRHINVPSGPTDKLDDSGKTLQNLLGITDTTEFSWYGWKPNLDLENAGRFTKQNLKGLGSNEGGEDSQIWSYAGKTTAGIGDIGETIDTLKLDTENPVIGVYLDGDDDLFTVRPLYVGAADPYSPPDPPTPEQLAKEFLESINADDPDDSDDSAALDEYYAPLKDITPLYSLIQLNKFMNHFDDYYPRETWKLNEANTHPGLEKKQAFGSYALLNEIKSAKGSPKVQWSGDVTFFINQNDGLIQGCPITENITFSLYLKDESMIAKTGKAITMKEMTFVGPRRDAVGATGGVDGERLDNNPEDVTGQAAGEVDLQWNPVSKKWQSGNVNMFCKLVTQLKPGKAPTLDYLLSNDIKETLEEEDNANCYIPSRGSGMLIRTQNSMPLQWSPNYAQTADTRCGPDGNTNKQIVPVYNFNPRKTYPSGEEVLLTQIDGVWHVSDLGQGEEEEAAPPVATGIGKWGPFTYTMTSSQFFFKGIPIFDGNRPQDEDDGRGYVDVTPRDAELGFHVNYYLSAGEEDKYLNLYRKYDLPGDEVTGRTPNGGYNFTQPFNTENYKRWSDRPAYFQQTSFDYLDSKVFGIRGKQGSIGTHPDTCSIASTSATVNSAGQVIPFEASEYTVRNSANCGAFFGCVFPDGYKGTEEYDSDDSRSFTIVATGAGSIDASKYFTEKNDDGSNPFDPGNGIEDRNDASVGALGQTEDPLKSYDVTENGWSRGSERYQPNIFYMGAANKRKSMPADVMLNASPDGKNGSPIKPIGVFNDIYPTGTGDMFNSFITSIPGKVNAGAWLSRQLENGNNDQSAFDFEPVSPGNIMFRPLKLEAYLGMGRLSTPFSEIGNPMNVEDVKDWVEKQSIPNFSQARSFPYTIFTEIATSTVSRNLPISAYAPDREFPNTKGNLAGYENGNNSAHSPLKWGAWTLHKKNYSKLHEYSYWEENIDYGGMFWTKEFILNGDPYRIDPAKGATGEENWKGAGAFGIIGTNLKVKANTTIGFTTRNLYGMGAGAAGSFTIQGGYAQQNKTWGVSNFIESYKQENIIDLSVRIYQGHPADQTLYDPRYFAVHHFNPGVDFVLDKYRGTGTIPTNELGQGKPIPRNYLSYEFKNLRGSDGDLLDTVTYEFPEASGADIRIPSRWEKHIDSEVGDAHQNDRTYDPIKLPSDSTVFKDATVDLGASTPSPPLMDDKYWLVDTKRNGKLLPYRYYAKTLGIPTSSSHVEMVKEEDVKGEQVWGHASKLIVTNYGTGFAIDDAVGIFEKDIVLRVTGTGELGSVTGLSVERFGSGISVNQTRATGDLIGSFTSNFTISPIVGAGEGFNGYFVAAGLQNSIQYDDKPFLIKRNGEEINRIAANEPGPKNVSTGANAQAESLAFIEDTETVEYTIHDLLKSDDGSYDIFFHFHNDISMTWFACGSHSNSTPWGDLRNIAESNEQFISIEGINLL